MNDLEQHTDILSLIRVRMSGLSKGHKRIAEYILANYEKCAFLTAAKLGEVVGVSESTAVRFPAALGFSGYPDFQDLIGHFVPASSQILQAPHDNHPTPPNS